MAALQLLADDVAPGVDYPFRQMPIAQQLDFNLVKPSFAVLGFDIDHRPQLTIATPKQFFIKGAFPLALVSVAHVWIVSTNP